MKKFFVCVFTLLLISVFGVPAFAAETENSYAREIWDMTDETAKEYLGELGVDAASFEELFSLTPTRVIKFIFKNAAEILSEIAGSIVLVFAVIIITSIAVSFLKDSDKTAEIIYFICSLTVMTAVIVPVSRILTDAAASVKMSAVFVNSYLPVMTAIIIASKNPSVAVTYNSFTLFMSDLIMNFADRLFVPMISCLLSFNILSSFSFEDFRSRILKTVRRLLVTLLALFSTVYSGLLTAQSVLASSSDSLALKGIRFISGAFVPVVGAGVGEAVSSVIGSFSLMKNTLGIFVITVIAVLNFPVMLELLIWYFALGICSIASSMFNLKYISDIIDGLSSVISLLNTVVFFITFVLTVSTGVIIVMGK